MSDIRVKSIGRNEPCYCGSGKKFKKCCFGKKYSGSAITDENNAQLLKQAQQYFQAEQYQQAIDCYQRVLATSANNVEAQHYLGLSLFQAGNEEPALQNLTASLKQSPDNAIYCNNMGMVLSKCGESADAENYYTKALDLDPSNIEAKFNLANLYISCEKNYKAIKILSSLAQENPDDLEISELFAEALEADKQAHEAIDVCSSILEKFPDRTSTKIIYGSVLASIGRYDEAEQIYANLCDTDPDSGSLLLKRAWWAVLQNKIDESEILVEKLLNQRNLDTIIRYGAYRHKAGILKHKKKYTEAKLWLEKINLDELDDGQKILFYSEQGQIFEKTKNYSEAFSAFKMCNTHRKKYFSVEYSHEQEIKNCARLKSVFKEKNVAEWKSKQLYTDQNKQNPIFILGFPRSGTSLVEQILSVHKKISAGGELSFLGFIEKKSAELLNSASVFPECLMGLSGKKNSNILSTFSKKYLNYAEDYNLLEPTSPWLTDKAPLNSTRLGTINLLFPESPIIHAIRHPLDVCLSAYFTNFLHGHWYSLDLEDTAFYFKEVFELIEHYKKNISDLKYIPIKYEDIILDPETSVRRMLEFIGEDYDERCLEFYNSKRVVRTASYAQVNKKLYTSSMYRYKNYRKEIEPIIPILMPVIEKMGYTIDD